MQSVDDTVWNEAKIIKYIFMSGVAQIFWG